MDQDEELGGSFLIAVDELGLTGLWSSIKEIFESRLPLLNVSLFNKVGKAVPVDKLSAQFVQSTDKRLLRLKPFSHSPVVWFRNPYAHLILVSTADINEYRANVKNQVRKAIADLEREWGGQAVLPEWMLVYIRPFGIDAQDKSIKKVFDKLVDDFSPRRRDRVVRLDLPQRAFDAWGTRVAAYGLDDLDTCMKDCVKSSFEGRQAAYMEEVKKLLNDRLEPTWSFATFYLVKDSFALMLEAAGMYEDAYKEYVELEACYLETLERGAVPNQDFGASGEGDDAATLINASWRVTRRSVLKRNGVPEFRFRQYLFAAQARLLLRLGRPIDVADRGLKFINTMMDVMAAKQAAGQLRPHFKESWTFSACMALLVTVTNGISRFESSSDLSAAHDTSPLSRTTAAPSADVPAAGLATARPANGPASLLRSRSIRGGSHPNLQGLAADRHPPPKARSGLGSDPSLLRQHSATPLAPAAPPAAAPLPDWDLGLPVPQELPMLAAGTLAGQATSPASLMAFREDPTLRFRETTIKTFYLMLGHLYALARQQLTILASHAYSGATGSGSSSNTEQAPAQSPDQKGKQQQQQQQAGQKQSLITAGATSSSTGSSTNGGSFPRIGYPPPTTPTQSSQSHVFALLTASPQPSSSAPPTTTAQVAKPSNTDNAPGSPAPITVFHYSRLLCGFTESSEDTRFEATPLAQPTQQQVLRASLVADQFRNEVAGPLQPSLATNSMGQRSQPSLLTGSASDGAALQQQAPLQGLGPASSLQQPEYSESSFSNIAVSEDDAPRGAPPSPRDAGPLHHAASDQLPAQQQQQHPAAASGRHFRHQHSASMDNGFFSKLDLFASKVTSMLDRPAMSLLSDSSSTTAANNNAAKLQQAAAFPPELKFGELLPLGGGGGQASSTKPSPRAVELHVDANASKTNTPPRPTLPASDSSLSWVADWRLRAALSLYERFEDLVLQLSLLAAWCYCRAGRVRNGSLVYADVALMLLHQGRTDAAHHLLDHLAHVAMVEGWNQLLALLLPQIIKCQLAIGHTMTLHTCLAYLGLPAGTAPHEERMEVLQLLLGLAHSATSWQLIAGHQLQSSNAIQVSVVNGQSSRFYGSPPNDNGVPMVPPPVRPDGSELPLHTARATATSSNASLASELHPSGVYSGKVAGTVGAGFGGPSQAGLPHQEEPDASGPDRPPGAWQLTVGDVVPLQVHVYSNLPTAITLSNVFLVLGLLQRASSSGNLTLSHSIRRRLSSTASVASASIFATAPALSGAIGVGNGSASKAQAGGGSGQAMHSQHSHSSSMPTGPSAGLSRSATDLATISHRRFPSDSGIPTTTPHFSPQLGDSFRSQRMSDPAAPAGSSSSTWLEGEDVYCSTLLASVQLPSSEAAAAAPKHSEAAAAVDMRSGSGEGVLLHPGANRWTFMFTPTSPGLYFVRHVNVTLGLCELHIKAVPPHQLNAGQWQAAAHMDGHGLTGHTPLGQVTPDGQVAFEAIVAVAEPLEQRMAVAAVAAGGSLVAGQQQWLGLTVAPLHDQLQRARLHVQARNQQLLRLHDPAADAVGAFMLDNLAADPNSNRNFSLTNSLRRSEGGVSFKVAVVDLPSAAAAAAAVPAPATPPISPSTSSAKAAAAAAAAAAKSDATTTNAATAAANSSSSGADNAVARTASDPTGASTGGPAAAVAQAAQAPAAAAAPAPAAGGEVGVHWANLARGTLDLAHALGSETISGPVLIWLPVYVSPPERPPDVVKVCQLRAELPSGAQLGRSQTSQSRPSTSKPLPTRELSGSHGGHPRDINLSFPSFATHLSPKSAPNIPPPLPSMRKPCTELDVSVDYKAGCWRSHSAAVSVPIRPPFIVTTQAHQLPNHQVLLHVRARYDGLLPAVVSDCVLTPQCSLEVVKDIAAVSGIFPALMAPGTQLLLLWILQQAPGEAALGQFDGGDSCKVTFTYTVQTQPSTTLQLPPIVASASSNPQEVPSHASSSSPPLWTAAYPAPPPPVAAANSACSAAAAVAAAAAAASLNAAAASVWGGGDALHTLSGASDSALVSAQGSLDPRGSGDVGPASAGPLGFSPPLSPRAMLSSMLSMRGGGGHAGAMSLYYHSFILEFPPDSHMGGKHNLVLVRLLGPIVCQLGDMAALTWQITRIGGDANQGAAGGTAARSVTSSKASSAANFMSVLWEEDEVLYYEVSQVVDPAGGLSPWRLTGSCKGTVRLGRSKGSMATVEAVVHPAASGPIPPPRLSLRGVQDILEDDGQGPVITVLP